MLTKISVNLHRSFLRYILISVLSFVGTIGLTILLTEEVSVPEENAYAIALITVFLMNFFFMRNYIYVSKGKNITEQFALYILSAAGFRGLEFLSFLVIHTWLGVQYQIGIICIQSGSFLFKFYYYRSVVFNRKGKRPVGVISNASNGKNHYEN